MGNASLVAPFSPGDLVSLQESVSTDTLSFGFHLLGMRARALDGAWGTTETRPVFVDKSDAGGIIEVDQVEYFFDVDPGVGSAVQVNPFVASNSVAFTEALISDTLSTGFHILGMRARAVGGSWGTTETRLVFFDQSQGVNSIDQLDQTKSRSTWDNIHEIDQSKSQSTRDNNDEMDQTKSWICDKCGQTYHQLKHFKAHIK